MKFMTSSAAEAKRQKAVDFLRSIGQDADADRFEAMNASEYAEHKGVELRDNPRRRRVTVKRSKSRSEPEADLENQSAYIEELEAKLDSIAGIAAGDDEEDEEEDETDEDYDED